MKGIVPFQFRTEKYSDILPNTQRFWPKLKRNRFAAQISVGVLHLLWRHQGMDYRNKNGASTRRENRARKPYRKASPSFLFFTIWIASLLQNAAEADKENDHNHQDAQKDQRSGG